MATYRPVDEPTLKSAKIKSRQSGGYCPASASGDIEIKSIFDSSPERHAYDLLVRLMYPLGFLPNVAMSAFMVYDSAKENLDRDLFRYFLMARVDILIINDYTPIGVVEIDSSWHDNVVSIEHDRMKEEILRLADVPLVRFRMPTGGYQLKDVDMEGLVLDIKKALR